MGASPFIAAEQFDSVRRALDVNLTVDDLPDEVIADDIYLLRAATHVLALDPDAASRTGSGETAIELATIFMTAALIYPALPQIVSEQFVDYRVKFNQFEPAQRVQELKEAASLQVALAIGDETRTRYMRPIAGFLLARGGRRAW